MRRREVRVGRPAIGQPSTGKTGCKALVRVVYGQILVQRAGLQAVTSQAGSR